jgi:hypothetical protein
MNIEPYVECEIILLHLVGNVIVDTFERVVDVEVPKKHRELATVG